MGRNASTTLNHIRLIHTPERGSQIECQHCLYEKTLHLPLTVTQFLKFTKAFEILHSDCKAKT